MTEGQLQIYFEELQHVPGQAFDDISRHLVRTAKSFPSPEEIENAWMEWAQANPHRMVKDEKREDCDECEGKGYIEAWTRDREFGHHKYAIPHFYSSLYPCAECFNWERIFPTSGSLRPRRFWTRNKLLEAGALLHNPYRFGTKPWWKVGRLNMKGITEDEAMEKITDMDALADMAAKDLNAAGGIF